MLPRRDSRDDEEHAELKEKVPQVAARQSIVEWLIPSVEANLPVGRCSDDKNDNGHQYHEPLAHR